MGFYHPAENPCVMRRANLKTKMCEYSDLSGDLYIVSTTPEEFFHIQRQIQDQYQSRFLPRR